MSKKKVKWIVIAAVATITLCINALVMAPATARAQVVDCGDYSDDQVCCIAHGCGWYSDSGNEYCGLPPDTVSAERHS